MPTDKYDSRILQAASTYFPRWDWRRYKAQLFVESGLEPTAVSPKGAKGLAQVMPGTWKDISKELDLPSTAEPTDPFFAIPAGAFYMAQLLGKWTAPRPDIDRYCLALASYNAGFSNVLAAQKAAGGANDYATIIKALPEITGDDAKETARYVSRVLTAYNQLVTGTMR